MSSEIGFPQMDFTTYPSQMFWLAVMFTAMYLLMSKVALPSVEKVKLARKSIQDTDLDKAEKLNNKADGLKSEYEQEMDEARKKSSETISVAEEAISDKINKAQEKMLKKTSERFEKALIEIAKIQEETLQSIEDISADISIEISKQVAEIITNNADAKKVVTAIKDGV